MYQLLGKSKKVCAPSPELDFTFHSNEPMSSGFSCKLSDKYSNTGDEEDLFKDTPDNYLLSYYLFQLYYFLELEKLKAAQNSQAVA